MTTDEFEEVQRGPGQEIDSLTERWQLSRSDCEQIAAAMENSGLSFVEAAVFRGVLRRAKTSAELQTFDGETSLPVHALVQIQVQTTNRFPRQWQEGSRRLGESLRAAADPQGKRFRLITGLRTELLMRARQNERPNALAVVSADSGDGRSQLAADLAVAFAQLGEPVLLVDGDFRMPSQHMLFPPGPDWIEPRSRQNADFARIGKVDSIPNLSILLQTGMRREPLDLLMGGRFEKQLREWERQFAHVIVDTPPASIFKDSVVIASLVNQVLLIGRADVTRHRVIADLRRRLLAAGVTDICAVLNRF